MRKICLRKFFNQCTLPYYTTRCSSLYLLLSKVVLDAQVARQMQKLTIHDDDSQ